jgi:hypothetical protein
MRRKHNAPFVALGLLLLTVSLAAVAGNAPPHQPQSAEVRRNYPREWRDFAKWLKQTIRPGWTTQQEVLDLLGSRCKDLDRPGRDGLFALEYDLAAMGIRGAQEEFLVFEFDRDRVLEYSFMSLGICGFCPHVFADDGGWRLEGKLLAGCVGEQGEGSDTLLLPRATVRQGHVRLRLSNLAPEIEFLDAAALGSVPLAPHEELDADSVGRPFAWTPTRAIPEAGRGGAMALGSGPDRILVLEVRNTAAFEHAMRDHFLGGAPEPAGSALRVTFDVGSAFNLPAVGSKFLRRVVVPIPPEARAATLPGTNPLWQVRRVWLGTGRIAAAHWQAPVGSDPAADLLRQADGRRLRLDPGQEVVLTFPAPPPAPAGSHGGFLLRLTGHYEFLPPAVPGGR